jgi:hypothetical protein
VNSILDYPEYEMKCVLDLQSEWQMGRSSHDKEEVELNGSS